MYFTDGKERAFETLMQVKPGFDRYSSGCAEQGNCDGCRFYRPRWKYQFCVYKECPYEPGRKTKRKHKKRACSADK